MKAKERFILFTSPVSVDYTRFKMIMISNIIGCIPFSALFAIAPAYMKLLLHYTGNVSPFLLVPLLPKKFQNFILFLSPNFSFRHYNFYIYKHLQIFISSFDVLAC